LDYSDPQYIAGWWLSHPSENMTSSVGMMKFPAEWKNKNVPSQQPDWVV